MADTLTVAVQHSAPASRDDPGAQGIIPLQQSRDVTICRDVWGGTHALQAKGRVYLPQFPKEADDLYLSRLNSSRLFNAYKKTVKGLTGMVFRKDPVIGDDVPEAVKTHLENVDLAGRHVAVFLRDAFLSKLIDGHGCILVDWHGPEGANNSLEEGDARPFWVWIEKSQVLRFRTESRDGQIVLTSFAYIESDIVPDGEFGEKEIERVRQLDLTDTGVRYRSWTREAGRGGAFEPEQVGRDLGPRMTRIPVVADYAMRTGFLTSDPPLLDLALENLEHYELRSDRKQNIKVGCVPVFVTVGVDEDKIGTFAVGPAIGLALPAGADAKYVEIAGPAFEETRQELNEIQQRMAALGLSMLQQQSRSAETAEAKRLDKSEQDSELSSAARSSEGAANEALMLHAMWMGLPEGGTVTVNRDFESQMMDAQTVTALAALVPHKISLDTFWDLMIQGEILPDTFDRGAERERIEQAGVQEMEAMAEMLRLRQQGGGDGDVDQEPDEQEKAA